ncbi:L,D-transpeptidase catalytic domain [Loktanella fryxellensis]|uniref:L,D-transpeptidase catalytic domain n=1 Tax=Loktanella fryxellensis TaxID=245187 RepID=A0A1H8HW57_9RHOB|nr:L,D-transpeptidase [Loktanella fryxellensis]SEN60116.1 L,D-transpeptidase catalytic domain [Loktanella fryxellensis]
MISRRTFAAGAALSLAASPALANPLSRLFGRPKVDRERFLPQEVDVSPDLPAGEIHVVKEDFFLYWTLGNGRARRYGIALGDEDRNYTGVLTVRRKREWPSWIPTPEMVRLEPEVYGPYAKGLPGGHPKNALGARALYLYDGGVDTYYRIHGTPQPETIGTGFSSGCVRLTNDHVSELYDLVPVGTHVYLF